MPLPSPYVGNEDAARYLLSLNTNETVSSRVSRLHDEAIRKKVNAIQRVEREMYPSYQTVFTSKTAVEEHIKRIYDDDLATRREHEIHLQNEVFSESGKFVPVASMDPAKLQDHVKRVYYDPLKRKERNRAT